VHPSNKVNLLLYLALRGRVQSYFLIGRLGPVILSFIRISFILFSCGRANRLFTLFTLFTLLAYLNYTLAS